MVFHFSWTDPPVVAALEFPFDHLLWLAIL